jgi:hypothetical protein
LTRFPQLACTFALSSLSWLVPSVHGQDLFEIQLYFEPALKVSYNLTKRLAPGLEYYGETDHFRPLDQQHHLIFPTLDVNTSSIRLELRGPSPPARKRLIFPPAFRIELRGQGGTLPDQERPKQRQRESAPDRTARQSSFPCKNQTPPTDVALQPGTGEPRNGTLPTARARIH